MKKNCTIPKMYKKRNKLLIINKFLLKGLQMFCIFLANVWNWKYIECWDVKQTFMYLFLCRFYYSKHTGSILLDWNKKSRVWLPKNTMLIKNHVSYLLLHQHIQICDMEVLQWTNIVKHEYMNVHYWQKMQTLVYNKYR